MSKYIYGLVDPLTNQLRYVGMTSNIKHRYAEHTCRTSRRTLRSNWIKSLKKKGVKPEMFIIEEVADDQWQEAERFWIAYFKYIGANLTNLTDGGEATYGWIPTEETKDKIRASHLGKKLTEEHKKKIGNSVRGQKRTPETIENIKRATKGKKHKPPSAETKAKWSAMRKGHVPWNKGIPCSPETREKLRKTSTGRKHSAKTIEHLRQINIGNQYSKGHKWNEEQRKQISERMRGNKHTLGRRLSIDHIIKTIATRARNRKERMNRNQLPLF